MPARLLALALLLAWTAAGLPAVAWGQGEAPGLGAVPELVVEAPERYAGLARRLRQLDAGRLAVVAGLAGLDRPGPPIRVLLAPEGSPPATAVPPWVSGYADGGAGVVVLLPARTPTYPDSSLDDLLRHEVSHVLVARAAGGRPLPRWFQEGVATVAGTSWGLDDRSYLAAALLGGGEISLAEVERRFAASEGEVRRAYAIAGAFVRDLVRRHGPGAVGRILAGVARDLPFEEAFQAAAGTSLAAAEADFWRRETFWYRWLPLLTSSVTLWMGITLLALFAIRHRRARDAALRRRWEEEESRAEMATAGLTSLDDDGEGWRPPPGESPDG